MYSVAEPVSVPYLPIKRHDSCKIVTIILDILYITVNAYSYVPLGALTIDGILLDYYEI